MNQTKTACNKLVSILLVAALAAAAWCVVTVHARNAHSGELLNSMDALSVMELAAHNPGACKVLIVATCPFATVADKTSPRFGELSPQARVYCGDNNSGVMAVFGLKNTETPVYITGYVVSRERFDHYCQRDRCAIMDLTYLQWLVK